MCRVFFHKQQQLLGFGFLNPVTQSGRLFTLLYGCVTIIVFGWCLEELSSCVITFFAFSVFATRSQKIRLEIEAKNQRSGEDDAEHEAVTWARSNLRITAMNLEVALLLVSGFWAVGTLYFFWLMGDTWSFLDAFYFST